MREWEIYKFTLPVKPRSNLVMVPETLKKFVIVLNSFNVLDVTFFLKFPILVEQIVKNIGPDKYMFGVLCVMVTSYCAISFRQSYFSKPVHV